MRLRKIIGAFLLFALTTLLIGGVVSATDKFQESKRATVNKNKTIDSSLYIAGENVKIAGTVNGDVFCAGQNVIITGKVSGDVFCAGQNIRVDGDIEGSVRLAGQIVTLSSNITKSATIFAQTFSDNDENTIGSDATIMAQSISIDGTIGRDLVIGGEAVTITGNIGRDIDGGADTLALEESAVIGGSVTYTSREALDRAEGAEVVGAIQRLEPASYKSGKDTDWAAAAGASAIGFWIYLVISLLIVSLALALIFPRQMHNASEHIVKTPGKALLVGFLASIVIPIILFVLLLTLLGIPLATLLFVTWLLVMIISYPLSGYAIGRLILRRNNDTKHPALAALLGGLVLILIYLIPIIGTLTFFFALWFGAGAVLLESQPRKGVKKVKAKA